MCRSHYRAERRAAGLEPRYVSPVKCSVDGCDKPQEVRGMCAMHVWRHDNNGDVNALVRQHQPDTCSVPGCEKAATTHSMCPMHYQRWRIHGDPLRADPRLMDRTAPCGHPGCVQPIGHRGNNGMCRRHARAAQRARRPEHYKGKLEARRRRVRVQTPPWANLAAIEAFYAATPAGHEVDHAVPLKGMRVSGLHVEYNLQYLPVSANRRKGNRV